MNLSLIAGVANNNAIGNKNKLLAHLPKDLKWFKQHTTGKTIIMGRKTYESLPSGALPNRRNIVLSRREDFSAKNCLVLHGADEVMERLADDEETFVIGGEEIYKIFLPFADKLYLTRIYADFSADVFFPQINFDEWNLTFESHNAIDEKHAYEFDFLIYEKK